MSNGLMFVIAALYFAAAMSAYYEHRPTLAMVMLCYCVANVGLVFLDSGAS